MNKYKEALHFFESYIGVTDSTVTNNLVEEYVDILNELIDKETPKKPLTPEQNHHVCPCCECCVYPIGQKSSWYKVFSKYCGNCGQRLDWEGN